MQNTWVIILEIFFTHISAPLGLMYKERKYSQTLMCAQDSLEVSLPKILSQFFMSLNNISCMDCCSGRILKGFWEEEPHLIPSCTSKESIMRTTV